MMLGTLIAGCLQAAAPDAPERGGGVRVGLAF
jgi:hypothetical protein